MQQSSSGCVERNTTPSLPWASLTATIALDNVKTSNAIIRTNPVILLLLNMFYTSDESVDDPQLLLLDVFNVEVVTIDSEQSRLRGAGE